MLDGFGATSTREILLDEDGAMWCSTLGAGACRYDGETFTAFREDQGLTINGLPNHVQDMYEDKDGILRFGCSGGLWRLVGESFINVTENGPWPTLFMDDVQLLSPPGGRLVATMRLVRQNLQRARQNAKAIGAEPQMGPRIDDLAARLDKLEEETRGVGQGAERTRRMLKLAQLVSASQDLADAVRIGNKGKTVKTVSLSGAEARSDWLANRELIRGLTTVRLFDTSIGDDVFARLEPAEGLVTFNARGKHLTGAGIERLTTDQLQNLYLSFTSASNYRESRCAACRWLFRSRHLGLGNGRQVRMERRRAGANRFSARSS